MKKKNIIETYNWLNEAFVHQTEEDTETETVEKTDKEAFDKLLKNPKLLTQRYKEVLKDIKYKKFSFYDLDLNNKLEFENFVRYIQVELFLKPLIDSECFSDERFGGYSIDLNSSGNLLGTLQWVYYDYDESDKDNYAVSSDGKYNLDYSITGEDGENQPWEENGEMWDMSSGLPNPLSEYLSKTYYSREADYIASTYKNWYWKTYEDFVESDGKININAYKARQKEIQFFQFLLRICNKEGIVDLSRFNIECTDDLDELVDYSSRPEIEDQLDEDEEEQENCGFYYSSLEISGDSLYLDIDFRNGERVVKGVHYIDITSGCGDLDEDQREYLTNDVLPQIYKVLNFEPKDDEE